jgi:hypothetical protein
MRSGSLDETYRSIDGVVVGEGQHLHAQCAGTRHQVFRMRTPVKQTEVGVTVKLDVVRHQREVIFFTGS